MTEGPLQLRILRYTLLGPIDDARISCDGYRTMRRSSTICGDARCARCRSSWGFCLQVSRVPQQWCSSSFAPASCFVLAATIVVAPIVLIASFSVQAYVLLSWLEGRSLAKLQEHHRPRHRGPIGQWLVRSYRIDMGPLPQVPWIPALLFFLVPARNAGPSRGAVGRGACGLSDCWRDLLRPDETLCTVSIILPRGRGRGTQVFRGSSSAGGAGSQAGRQPGLRLPRGRSGTGSWTRRLRSFVQSGFRFLRFLVELCLLNLLPFVEYCVLVAGIFAIAQGRRSATEQHVALGMLLVGVALLLAGLASIVTKRMSFRFYGSARTSYAGATALITGMMQVIVGGLAVATAHALATPRVAGEARCPPHEPVALCSFRSGCC